MLACCCWSLPCRALRAGGAEPAPASTARRSIRPTSRRLQRGARNFVNYCLNCHSAKYMRYNRLTDLGLDRGADPATT